MPDQTHDNAMKVPLTIVVPSCARSHLLERTLQSLSECDLPSNLKEVVVVENGPRGHAEALVARFRDVLPIRHRHIERANKSYALNQILAGYENEFVIFFDDDVRLHPQILTAYAKAVGDRTGGTFWGGRCLVDQEKAPPDWLVPYLPDSARGWSPSDTAFELSAPNALGFNWGVFARDFNEVGGFDERRGPGTGVTGDEPDLQKRLFERGVRGYYLPEAVVWHYVPEERCTPEWALDRIRVTAISKGIYLTEGGWRLCCYKAAALRVRMAILSLVLSCGKFRLGTLQLFRYKFQRQWIRGALEGMKLAAVQKSRKVCVDTQESVISQNTSCV